MRESPPWVPVLMVALLVLGAVIIMARNLVFSGNNWLTVLGLGCILGGLFTATKWR
jgi:LPXTG-motif cell wall-anchored protein